jgi:hypothetical protein
VPGYDLVEGVDDRGGVERSKHPPEGPGQPDFREQQDAASRVARNRSPVAEDEPPAFVARVLGYACEQAAGLFVGERQQSKLFAPVEPGDDTRRPAAELSGAGVEENRAREPRSRRCGKVLGHPAEPTRPHRAARAGNRLTLIYSNDNLNM